MMSKIFVFLFFFLAFVSNMDAQVVEQCGTEAFRKNSMKNHPELAEKRLETQRIIQDFEKNGVHSREVYVIPVVFHIVHNSDEENISEQQVYSQIASLNRDFRKKNENLSVIHKDFEPVVADIGIEFCLATKDPLGNETSGITRTQTPHINIGQKINISDGRPNIFYSNLGGTDAWDTDKYLNVWVCKINSSILGFAAFPGTTVAEEDGIIMDYRAFGSVGTATSPNDLGKTLTHEIGHYLDLQHIWGNFVGDCDSDDGIDDTPEQERPTSGCPFERQVSCGSFDMFYDYMDYSTDECLAMFTEGQKTRMLATLLTVRKELLEANVCNQTLSNSPLDNLKMDNLVNDEMTISIEDGNIFEVDVRVINIFGQVMQVDKTFFFPGAYTIDVSYYPTGAYFAIFSTSDNQVVKKLVVAH